MKLLPHDESQKLEEWEANIINAIKECEKETDSLLFLISGLHGLKKVNKNALRILDELIEHVNIIRKLKEEGE